MPHIRKRWPWSLLFASVLIIIAVLATSWNWVVVRNYQEKLPTVSGDSPWLNVVLGSLGFLALIVLFTVFFSRLLREMKLNQLQKDFLANVTHELKTPLASIELSSNLLQKDSQLSDDDKRDLWQAHDIELRRLQDEIEKLLQTSRWEHVQSKPRLRDVHLEDWLQESLRRWQRQYPAPTTIIRQGDFLNGSAALDPSLLKLITSNILDNSVKFSAGGNAKIEITTTIVWVKQRRFWKIEFSDRGIGFAPRDAKKMFRRFIRLNQPRDHMIPGSGLGLHLAQTAAQAMRVRLHAHSDGLGCGAKLSLSGPLSDEATPL